MPVDVSCSASHSSVDITWQAPDTKCVITGFDVTWDYDILWSNNDSKAGSETVQDNHYSIKKVIPYFDYFVQVTTLVEDLSGIEYAECTAETPQESEF